MSLWYHYQFLVILQVTFKFQQSGTQWTISSHACQQKNHLWRGTHSHKLQNKQNILRHSSFEGPSSWDQNLPSPEWRQSLTKAPDSKISLSVLIEIQIYYAYTSYTYSYTSYSASVTKNCPKKLNTVLDTDFFLLKNDPCPSSIV